MGLPSGQGLGSAAFSPYMQSMYSGCNFMKCTYACSSINVPALATYEFYTGYYATVTGYSYATAPCSGACNTQNMTEINTNLALLGPQSICVNAANWNLVSLMSYLFSCEIDSLSLIWYVIVSTPAGS